MFLTNGVKFFRRSAFNHLAASYGCRRIATERTNYVSVTMDPEFDGSVAVVKMQKKPVNSLCSNHIKELAKTVSDLENNENVRAMIITSAFPGVFCAGLDLKFMLDVKYDDFYTYWKGLQDMAMMFVRSRLITIAAVNGHCMAGGNIFALAADYRVMAEGAYRIGLNEVMLGLPVPLYLQQLMANLIGTKRAERAVQLATLFTTAEAYKVGLVEEVVPVDQVMTAAKKEVKQWLKMPDTSRTSMKLLLRKRMIQQFNDDREEEAQTYASIITRPDIQEQVRRSLDNLKN